MDPVTILQQHFATRDALESGWRQLCNAVRQHYPHAPWHMLEALDLQREHRSFQAWLDDNLPQRPPQVAAWYFGINEEADAVHLDACAAFDPADAGCDWACDYIWRSDDDWTDSIGLARIVDLSIEADEEIPVLLYTLALGYVSLLVGNCAPALQPVAVGFDDGDAYVLPKRP